MYIYYKITVTNQPPGHVLTQYNTRYPSLYIYISTTKLSKLLVTSHLIGCFDLPWCGGYRGEPQSTACLIGQHKGNKRHSSPLTTQGGATWGVGKVLRIRRAKKNKYFSEYKQILRFSPLQKNKDEEYLHVMKPFIFDSFCNKLDNFVNYKSQRKTTNI